MKGKEGKRLTSLILIVSMLAGGVLQIPSSSVAEAAGKVAVKNKSIKLYVGQKKKITISRKKKKAKYQFSTSKVKVARVSKKGIVTARRVGVAKISVKQKLAGKVRKVGTVKVTVRKKGSSSSRKAVPIATEQVAERHVNTTPTPDFAAAAPSPTTDAAAKQTPEVTPEATPEQTKTPVTPNESELEAAQWKSIDLSQYNTYNIQDNCTFDKESGVLSMVDQEFVGFPLQQDLIEGQYVLVKVKGVNLGSAGFRSWLVVGAANNQTCCDEKDGLLKFMENGNTDFKVGPFEITYKLTATTDCNYLFFKGPAYQSNIENLSISAIEVSYSEKNQTADFQPTEAQRTKMLEDSLLSTGNNAKIKSVIEKARSGEDVTLAYIGGSVTEGQGANPNAKCYAELSCSEFARAYGTGENVHFVNAGMSGTPSALGVIRYERDVLGQTSSGQNPDILFIEFAVNDSDECTAGGAYDGLIQKALGAGSAVVLVYSVFQNHWNMQDTYIPYGNHYKLPMVSMKSATDSVYQIEGFNKWYFSDTLHPSNQGYQLTSDCIMHMFDTIDKQEPMNDSSNISAYKTDEFAATTMLAPDTVSALLGKENTALHSFEAGGFQNTDTATGVYLFNSTRQKFSSNWMHKANSTDIALRAEITCKNLMIVYKQSSNANTGTAELYVDGVKKCTMNGYDQGGWNNAITELAFRDTEAERHIIEIKMAPGNESKEFTVLAMGYNE